MSPTTKAISFTGAAAGHRSTSIIRYRRVLTPAGFTMRSRCPRGKMCRDPISWPAVLRRAILGCRSTRRRSGISSFRYGAHSKPMIRPRSPTANGYGCSTKGREFKPALSAMKGQAVKAISTIPGRLAGRTGSCCMLSGPPTAYRFHGVVLCTGRSTMAADRRL